MRRAFLASLIACLALGADKPGVRPEKVTLTGKVLLLPEVLKSLGITADSNTVSKQIVLQADDGNLTPLLSDDASRALLLDERLRNRQSEIEARRFNTLPYLQVTSFRVKEDGRFRTPEYYCDVCTISVRYPQVCPCCQGPMVLRMKPDDR
jgi:hypothetical protein